MAHKPEAEREFNFVIPFAVILKDGSQSMETFPVQALFAHLYVKPSSVRLSIEQKNMQRYDRPMSGSYTQMTQRDVV